MKFTSNKSYKKYKIIRDKLNKYFPIAENKNYKKLNKEQREFINTILNDFIENTQLNGRRFFHSECCKLLAKNRLNTLIECERFYFVTKTEIERKLKKYNYLLSDDIAIKKHKYDSTYDYYFLIFIRCENERI